MTGLWWWVLPAIAFVGVVLLLRVPAMKGRRMVRRAPVTRHSAAISAWTIDIVAGGVIGVCLVGGLGQSALVTGGTVATAFDITVFVTAGVVVGVVFMRVIRGRKPLPPPPTTEARKSPPDKGTAR